MHKIKYTILILSLMWFFGCSGDVSEFSDEVRVASLIGPTGMGLVEVMDEHSDLYDVQLLSSPDQIIPKILNGEVDVATIPSNLAAVLYNKGGGSFSIVATTAMGVLYIVGDNDHIKKFDDLKNSDVLYASGQGATPEYVLNRLLSYNQIDNIPVRYLSQHTELASMLVSGKVKIALLPEPFVSTAIHRNDNLKVLINLSDEWKKIYGMDMPMSVVIVQNKFIEENEELFKKFMKDYEESIRFVNDRPDESAVLLEKYDIISDIQIALKAIPRCSLCFVTGAENQKMLKNYFEVLFEANPKSVGGKIPDEQIYYKK